MKSPLYYERIAHVNGSSPFEPDLKDLGAEDREKIAALAESDREFLERRPPEIFLADLAKKRRRVRVRVYALWPCLAAASVFLMFTLATMDSPQESSIRIKSADLNLVVYHKTPAGSEILPPSVPLRQSEEVQLAYFSRERLYAAILSLDGRGKVTHHLPLNGAGAPAIETEKIEILPYSYRLDDAPEYETFFLIVSQDPFEGRAMAPFLKAAYKNHSVNLELPSGFRYASFQVLKEEKTR